MLYIYSIFYRFIGTVFCLISPFILIGVSRDNLPLTNAILIFLVLLSIGIVFFMVGQDLKNLKKRVRYTISVPVVAASAYISTAVIFAFENGNYTALFVELAIILFLVSSAIYVNSVKIKSKFS